VLVGAQKWGAPVLDERELSAAVVLCQPDHLQDLAAAFQSICVPLSAQEYRLKEWLFNSAVSVTAFGVPLSAQEYRLAEGMAAFNSPAVSVTAFCVPLSAQSQQLSL
jgi:hypothetical protein